MSLPATLLLGSLLVFPAFAVSRLGIELRMALAYAFVASGITYLIYASDKKRARLNAWRIPEVALHSLELVGGWPGAFVAQRRLRHKCVKLKYQVVFWTVVAFHQYLAFGLLQGWELPKTILRAIWDVTVRLAP